MATTFRTRTTRNDWITAYRAASSSVRYTATIARPWSTSYIFVGAAASAPEVPIMVSIGTGVAEPP
jgi:hypothetical protein